LRLRRPSSPVACCPVVVPTFLSAVVADSSSCPLKSLPTRTPCQTLMLGLPSLPGRIKTLINSHPNPSVSGLPTSLLLRHSFFSVALHRSALPLTRPIHSTAIRPATQPETNSPFNPCPVSGSILILHVSPVVILTRGQALIWSWKSPPSTTTTSTSPLTHQPYRSTWTIRSNLPSLFLIPAGLDHV
jgi:hypothetical protein